jgi:N,N'-diacetyllegionaminate synthase
MSGRVFIIAEAGVNHNGSIDRARELVQAAKVAGADAVKFQTFKAERVAQATAPKAAYQLENTNPAESQIDMLRKLELPLDAHRELVELCVKSGLEFISTPYNEEDVEFLASLGVRTLKLASIHLFEPHFLRCCARTGCRLILSTGMATLDDVGSAVRALRAADCRDFTLLQCTTNYPSRIEDANVRAMVTIRETFGCAVGYSDHTQNDISCIAAVALGASMIEKHLTLDKSLPGPDHSSAANPEEFAVLTQNIRLTEAALGTGIKEPCAAEAANARNMRRSLVARRAIAPGESLTEEMISCKRPASGINPQQIDEVLGRKAAVEIPAGAQLDWAMLQ